MFAFSGISSPLATSAAASSKATATADFALFFEQQLKSDGRMAVSAEAPAQPPQALQPQLGTSAAVAPLATAPQAGLEAKLVVATEPQQAPDTLTVQPGSVQAEAAAVQSATQNISQAAATAEPVSDSTASESQSHSALAEPSAGASSAAHAPPDPARATGPSPHTSAWIWEDWHWSQQAEPPAAQLEAIPAPTDTHKSGHPPASVQVTVSLPPESPPELSSPEPDTAEAHLPESTRAREAALPASPQPVPVTQAEDLQQPVRPAETLPRLAVVMTASSRHRSLPSTGIAAAERSLPVVFASPAGPGPNKLAPLFTAPVLTAPGLSPDAAVAVLSPDLSPTLSLDALGLTFGSLPENPAHPLFFMAHNSADSPLQRLVTAQRSALGSLPAPQALGAEIRRQLGLQSIRAILQQSQQSLRVQLEPAWLGKMTLEVQRGPQGLQIQIFADQRLTRELLDAQSGQLRQQLSDLGLIITALRIGQSSPDLESGDHGQHKDSEAPWQGVLPHSRGQPAFQLDAGSLSGLPAEPGKSLPEMSLIHFVV